MLKARSSEVKTKKKAEARTPNDKPSHTLSQIHRTLLHPASSITAFADDGSTPSSSRLKDGSHPDGLVTLVDQSTNNGSGIFNKVAGNQYNYYTAPKSDQDKYPSDHNPCYVLYIPRRFLSATPRDIISRIADWASNCGTPTILYLRPYPDAGKSPTGGPSTLAQQLSEVGCLDKILAQVNARPETRTSLFWHRISRELTRRFALYREVVAERIQAREMRLANNPVSSRQGDRRSKRRPPAGGLVGLAKSLQELRLAKQQEHRVAQGDPKRATGVGSGVISKGFASKAKARPVVRNGTQ
ncbi:hypothetical protein CCMSSC00406_0007212 [Pleurotus cornucopiae]|uniref:Uncharacterized protein n=1 Tax=Pleurotus cornucopiae TaxID=5321 RepID=A0ACB7ITM3_PLECO|nr:hypothetical protein CCMSSC00406_0007212 [Pleurotus cornucopiae]